MIIVPSYPQEHFSIFSTNGSIESGAMAMTAMHTITSGGASWPSANLAVYMPFWVNASIRVDRFHILNGSIITGNVDMGVFDGKSFAKLGSTGATALSGTGVVQIINAASTFTIKPGFYLFGVSVSSTSPNPARVFYQNTFTENMIGMRQEASAHPLPATATPVLVTNTYGVPWAGFIREGGFP